MANNSSHTIWYIIGGIVIVGGFFAWRYLAKSNSKESQEQQVTEEELKRKEEEERKREEEERRHKEAELKSSLKDHFIPILKHFSGCINALSDVINENDVESAEITFRNIELIIEGHGDEMLKKWFNENGYDRKSWSIDIYKDKAKQIQQILMSCGLKSSTEIKLTWNADAAKHYRKLFKVEEGQVCDVIAPCWIYQNQVFEQGLVRASK